MWSIYLNERIKSSQARIFHALSFISAPSVFRLSHLGRLQVKYWQIQSQKRVECEFRQFVQSAERKLWPFLCILSLLCAETVFDAFRTKNLSNQHSFLKIFWRKSPPYKAILNNLNRYIISFRIILLNVPEMSPNLNHITELCFNNSI